MKPMYTINSAQILFLFFFCSGAYAQIESVKIGKQEWTVKNLDAAGFRNGDLISEVKGVAEWMAAGEAGQPAWCYVENNPANGTIYGKLYNWYAVSDPRGLCPTGWHVPSNAEWTQLAEYLGGDDVAGTKMKATVGWEDYEGMPGNGSNQSGFSGLPGGDRDTNGNFSFIGSYGYWWSSSATGADNVWIRYLNSKSRGSNRDFFLTKKTGISVRCLKD